MGGGPLLLQTLARRIDENLDYGSLYFFPTLWAVNVQWHEKPERPVDSYAVPKGASALRAKNLRLIA